MQKEIIAPFSEFQLTASCSQSSYNSQEPVGSEVISIIIATRNRAPSIEKTLNSLRQMIVPSDLNWEIVIVDNHSMDSTPQIIRNFERTAGLNITCLIEFKQGVSRAKNTGIAHARGDIIAFIDDDIIPSKEWLTIISREFSCDPHLGLLSGRVELFDPTALPMSIKRHTERRILTSLADVFDLPIGCNFAVRRELIKHIGSFDPEMGPGTRVRSADDLDLFYRAWRSGAKFVYEPAMLVLHDHGRKSVTAGTELKRAYLIGRGAFYAKYLFEDKLMAKWMYWDVNPQALFSLTDGRPARNRAWFLLKGFQTYLMTRLTSRAAAEFKSRQVAFNSTMH